MFPRTIGIQAAIAMAGAFMWSALAQAPATESQIALTRVQEGRTSKKSRIEPRLVHDSSRNGTLRLG